MDGRMNVKKTSNSILRSSWSHWGEVLASEFRAISAAGNARVSAQSNLPPLHDCGIVGNEIVTIFAVFSNDRVPGPVVRVDLMAGAVAMVNFQQALANGLRAEVADAVSSLAERGCGRGIGHPRVLEDLLDCDPGRATRV